MLPSSEQTFQTVYIWILHQHFIITVLQLNNNNNNFIIIIIYDLNFWKIQAFTLNPKCT